jgi:allophanate hydrolase subunit 2
MADVLDALVGAAWEVRPESNRMGLRLSGPTIRGGGRGDLVSFPTWWGAVQLPPDGEPLVLLVDGPTVGGYPVVAVVASADRPILGQLGAGDGVRFELVSEADAQVEATRRRLGQR